MYAGFQLEQEQSVGLAQSAHKALFSALPDRYKISRVTGTALHTTE